VITTMTMPLRAATGLLTQVKEIGPLSLCILGLIGFGLLNTWITQKVSDVVQANTAAMTQVVNATQVQAAYNLHLDAQIEKILNNQDRLSRELETRGTR